MNKTLMLFIAAIIGNSANAEAGAFGCVVGANVIGVTSKKNNIECEARDNAELVVAYEAAQSRLNSSEAAALAALAAKDAADAAVDKDDKANQADQAKNAFERLSSKLESKGIDSEDKREAAKEAYGATAKLKYWGGQRSVVNVFGTYGVSDSLNFVFGVNASHVYKDSYYVAGVFGLEYRIADVTVMLVATGNLDKKFGFKAQIAYTVYGDLAVLVALTGVVYGASSITDSVRAEFGLQYRVC